MLDVVIALLPATVVGCVYFGWKALLIVAIAVLTAVLTEVLYRMIFNRETFKEAVKIDFSSVVTGLLIDSIWACRWLGTYPFSLPFSQSPLPKCFSAEREEIFSIRRLQAEFSYSSAFCP